MRRFRYGEMAMKCPNCGTENVDQARFCQSCARPLGPAYSQPQAYIASQPSQTSKAGLSGLKLAILIVVIIALLLAPIIIYTAPLSKIKVIVSHSEYSSIGVDIYIDGTLKGSVGINPGTTIVGIWSVTAGTHTVQIDRGDWYFVDNWFFDDYWDYEGPDGYADFTYAYEVGPLYTKNVRVTLT